MKESAKIVELSDVGEGFFGDDTGGEERMADKRKTAEAGSEKPAKPGRKAPVKWGPEPVVKHQFEEYPDTVRLRDPTTVVYDLSKPSDVEAYNKIRRAERAEGGPRVAVVDYERQFYEGRWVVLITYEKVEYQQLI